MRRIKEFLKNRVEKAAQNQKGFSLVELIIVIAILGIIAAIALPNITGAVDKARANTDLSNAKAIANAVAIVEAKQAGNSGITKETAETAAYVEVSTLANVVAELNGGAPKAKLVKDTKFFVRITKNGTIRVGIGKTAGTESDIEEVYPDTSTTWIK